MADSLVLRTFILTDIPAMTAIYAHYVAHSTVTFDEEQPTGAGMAKKFGDMIARGHPVIIAEQDGQVRGYAYASTHRPRPAYRFTCEDTLYLHPDAIGQGLGSRLMKELIIQAKAFGFKQMIGVIEASAQSSIALHTKFGFDVVGRNNDVGYKFKRWHSTICLQRAL